MFVYYSCSHNATTEPTSVTQDSTDTIERKASILTKHNTMLSTGIDYEILCFARIITNVI